MSNIFTMLGSGFGTLILASACVGTIEGTGEEGEPSIDDGTAVAGAGGTDPQHGDGSVSPDRHLTGQEVFQKQCAVCHGSEGEGTARGPEVRHPVPGYSSFIVREGRTTTDFPIAMSAYEASKVTDEQLDEMWSWLGGLPKPTDGEGLYADYCANCHGGDGRSGRAGDSIADKEQGDIEEKAREGEGGSNYASREYMPGWNSAELTRGELGLIADYLGK